MTVTGLFISLLGHESAWGKVLSERALLQRCYGQITGQRIPLGSPLFNRLGTSKATSICMEILESANFDSQGMISADPVARSVLRKWNDLHRSWFKPQMQSTFEVGERMVGTMDIIDTTEPGMFITRSLLTPGYHYRDVLRGYDRLEGVRDGSKASAAGSPSGVTRPSRRVYHAIDDARDANGNIVFNLNSPVIVYANSPDRFGNLISAVLPYATAPATLLSVGPLMGIRVRQDSATTPFLLTQHANGTAIGNEAHLQVPHDLRKNHGGGALGSQAFLLYNFGHGYEYVSNGTTKLPRALMATAFKTFLCKEAPYLKDGDVVMDSRSAPAPSFRGQTSCLKCHSTLDPAAMTARNLTPATTTLIAASDVRAPASVVAYNVVAGPEAGQEFWPSHPVGTFRLQNPTGRLYFRSINGALVNQEITGLNALGTVMSDTEDYYACAVKRYVEHLTGLQFSLEQSHQRANSSSSYQRAQHWREFTLALAKELRLTGNLKQVIRRIMESDHYRQSGMGR